MSQHTPTPWRMVETGEKLKEETFEIEPSMKEDGYGGGYRWFNRADAEFIVRAVNSHEELLAAAKLMKRILKENRNFTPEEFSQVQDAIAKAEVRP